MHAAWARLLGVAAVINDKGWEAAGGDSLKSLELIFDLEAALKRRISMRLLGPSTRPSDLIASLQGAATGRVEATEMRPLLFLLGAGGDFLDLLRLAHSLSDVAKVEVLDYAPINPAALRIIVLGDLVADVIEPIRSAAQRGEPVRVLGWSLGGFVAIEVARQLAAEGHTIEFVGLLDTSSLPLRWNLDNTNPDTIPRHLADQVNEPIFKRILRSTRKGTFWQVRPKRVFAVALEKLLHRRHFAVVRSLWGVLNLMHLRKASVWFHIKTTRFIRKDAVMNARASYYPGALALFRSAYQEWDRLEMPDDLGWGQFCARVSVRHVPGNHWSLMAPGNVEATSGAVAEALRESRIRTSL